MRCPLCLEPGRHEDVCRKCLDTLAALDRRARGRVTGHALVEALRALDAFNVTTSEAAARLRCVAWPVAA